MPGTELSLRALSLLILTALHEVEITTPIL